jgi:hypothetical protein
VDAGNWLSYGLDPSLLMTAAGMAPDPWQTRALRSDARRVLLLAPRQSGKSTVVSLIALHAAMFREHALILLVSRAERQSLELFRKLVETFHVLGDPVPVVRELTFSLELGTGSRIIALPHDPATLRGFSGPHLIIVDEAAQVDDPLYVAVLPMLAVSGGRLLALSTPFGRRGFFWEQWENGDPAWERITARASECPRISREFLEEQKRLLGPRWYAQEFDCAFIEATGQVFPSELILAAFDSDEPPLFAKAMSHAG